MSNKALVISPFWAIILGTVIASGVIGGFAYAWDNSSKQAVLQEKVGRIDQADLPDRMSRIEVELKNINDKLDFLVRDRRQ